MVQAGKKGMISGTLLINVLSEWKCILDRIWIKSFQAKEKHQLIHQNDEE